MKVTEDYALAMYVRVANLTGYNFDDRSANDAFTVEDLYSRGWYPVLGNGEYAEHLMEVNLNETEILVHDDMPALMGFAIPALNVVIGCPPKNLCNYVGLLHELGHINGGFQILPDDSVIKELGAWDWARKNTPYEIDKHIRQSLGFYIRDKSIQISPYGFLSDRARQTCMDFLKAVKLWKEFSIEEQEYFRI